jgi:diguanylate cyclase (GGDEF)-like protein/PAS domain S-box-containing protein
MLPDFEIPIHLSELVIPSVCTGILFTGFILFIYIFSRTKQTLYASMFTFCVLSFVFVISETFIVIFGSYHHDIVLGRQMHRLEQIAGLFFIPAIPYFISSLLKKESRLSRFNNVLIFGGLVIAAGITVTAFIRPDLFISIDSPSIGWQYRESTYGRGANGILYTVRDILLGIYIVYFIIFLIRDMVRNKTAAFLLPILFGILIAVITAADDIIHSYTRTHFFMPNAHFPRFAAGVTVFILFTMGSVMRRFILQAQQVEQAYNAFHKSEARFLQIANNINEVFWLIEAGTNRLLYISPAYEKIWKQSAAPLYSSLDSWKKTIHPDDREKVQGLIEASSLEKETAVEYRILLEDGNTQRWIRERFFPISSEEDEGTLRIARLSEDITEKKHAEEELIYLAYHDQLTGLLNRKSFYERFGDIIKQAGRYRSEYTRALLFIDLDNFKDINDSLGHDSGDDLLRQVASSLQDTVRSSDTVFRIGGDEFTIVLSKIEEETDAAVVAEKILDNFLKPFQVLERSIYVSMSIGIAVYPKDGETVETLIKNADTALYEAKKNKNRYQHFTEELQNIALEKMKITTSLREAVHAGTFSVKYQPQIEEGNKIAGAEALLRWEHPELGHVSPARFIPLAEESGLIVPLGAWVLRHVCERVRYFFDRDVKIPISINISVKQFLNKDIVQFILGTLEEHSIPPEHLHIEITESFFLEDQERILSKLYRLSEEGIHFSIDDFGTGYSSLSYLKRLPIRTIKIDRAFITGIPHDPSDVSLVRTIVSLCKGLNLRIIAEGAETEEQVNFLHEIGCTIIQGYYYCKPMTESELITFVQTRSN